METFDDGSQVQDPGRVREYLVALHENMVDARTRRLIFADSVAYLEGDCADSSTGGSNRVTYCVAYDEIDAKMADALLWRDRASSAEAVQSGFGSLTPGSRSATACVPNHGRPPRMSRTTVPCHAPGPEFRVRGRW